MVGVMKCLNGPGKPATFQKTRRSAQSRPEGKGGRRLQQKDRTKKLIEWFVKAALRHAEAIEAMQEEVAALQVAALTRYFKALQAEPDWLPRFSELLQHENPVIAGMVAVYALPRDPERCRPVLVRLAQVPGLIGFRSQVALQRWDAGEWQEL